MLQDVTSDLRRVACRRTSVPLDGHRTLLGNSIGNTCAVFDVTRQLAAGRINIVAPGFANRCDKPGFQKHRGKLLNGCIV